MTWMHVVQWILLIWLVSLLLRSILEIFKLDGLDHIVTGILFVMFGFAWIATVYWKFDINRIFFPYFVQSSVGLLLASYGIRMIWKKPIGSIAVCVLIVFVSGFLYYNAPARAENEYSFLSRYFPFLSSKIMNDDMVDQDKEKLSTLKEFDKVSFYGNKEDDKLMITTSVGNLSLKVYPLDVLFSISSAIKVEDLSNHHFKITNSGDKTIVLVRDHLKELTINKDMGNIEGRLQGTYESVILDSDAGNIDLDLEGKIESLSCHLNMGNLSLRIYSLIPTVTAKVDVGNITIHIAKGLRVETDSIKTNVGQIKIEQNGDGSIGTIKLQAETNIGNIVIIADL